jgi:sensor histidine kinase YesM
LTAAEKAENGIIEITIKYEKGVFFVIVENDFRGMIKEDKSMLKTTKGDKINHGIGLNNVKKVVERYKGDLLIDYNEDKFRVEISMYERADE